MALSRDSIISVPLVADWVGGGTTFPVMVVLGPVIALLDAFWRRERRVGTEG